MASYREFYEQSKKRKRKKFIRRLIALLVFLLLLFIIAGVAVTLLGGKSSKSSKTTKAASSSVASSSASSEESSAEATQTSVDVTEEVLAPLPKMDGSTETVNEWNTVGPVEQTLDYTFHSTDYRMIALPECGVVDGSYFDDATFVGDSLTQGLQLYNTGLPNAHFCAYKGIGPNSIVNGAVLTRQDGGTEVAMDALVASNPKYVYILLGTNTLISEGSEDGFLAYYEKMLDMMQEQLGDDVKFYIQAIPPVRPEVCQTARTAGLENNRLRTINSSLAQLALKKGCYFVDLQEALADSDGNLNEEYAYSDGIHMKPVGYQAWVDYLSTHVAYSADNPYLYGSPYYIG